MHTTFHRNARGRKLSNSDDVNCTTLTKNGGKRSSKSVCVSGFGIFWDVFLTLKLSEPKSPNFSSRHITPFHILLGYTSTRGVVIVGFHFAGAYFFMITHDVKRMKPRSHGCKRLVKMSKTIIIIDEFKKNHRSMFVWLNKNGLMTYARSGLGGGFFSDANCAVASLGVHCTPKK